MSDETTIALERLQREVFQLRAESEARRVLGRYMYLCDVPAPEWEMTTEERVQAIADCFTDDAIWEGVGGTHGAQFGAHHGPAAIAAHMRRFYDAQEPRQVFNTHYLCTEQVRWDGEGVEGNWVQFQPWIDAQGASILRSSRLHVQFRNTGEAWKISRYRTENLFIAKLPNNWTDTRIEKAHLMRRGDA